MLNTVSPTTASRSTPNKTRTPADFAAELQARQATPTVGQQQPELSRTTQISDDLVITRAQEAASRLIANASWQDWVSVGRALQIGRAHAMYEAGTNVPKGSKFAACISRWLTAMKLDRVADKGTRSRLLNLLDHIDAVEKWRQLLPPTRRLELNHPNAVWRHWQRSKVAPDPNKAQKPSPFAAVKQSLIESQEEVARLKEANGGNLFTRETSAKDVVRILRDTFSTSKFNEIRRLINTAAGNES
jgi:hypothetical protein